MGILIWDDNFARNLNVCTERGVEIAWKKKKKAVCLNHYQPFPC